MIFGRRELNTGLGLLALAVTACNVAAADSRSIERPALSEAGDLVATGGELELDAAAYEAAAQAERSAPQVLATQPGSTPELANESMGPALPPGPPPAVAHRVARQKHTVYGKPDPSSPIRGRVLMGRAFAVYGYADGPGCDEQWADVGNGGYLCLDKTRPAGERLPQAEPPMRGHNGLTPYFYAQKKKGEDAPRWRSVRALAKGAQPSDLLAAGTDYAFVTRRFVRGDVVLVDSKGRAVREKDVKRFRPSRFEGRNLAEQPVPEGKQLAWVVSWPKGELVAQPDPEAEALPALDYHTELLVDPAPFKNESGTWYHTESGAWIAAKSLRVFSAPADRPDGVGDGEMWIDVDLDQQMLTAMVGAEPVFTTLISSGAKAPTPRGVFRIRTKQAVGAMSSSPGADDFYAVEAVPFVQYFYGSFALHGAYWHNYFGKPISHGCVNLSPKDSQHVFSLTAPNVSDGWIHAYETSEEQGTVVRVRRGNTPVNDRRKDVEPVFGA